ncbi:MAG: HlyD family type I secretion periplasmic adaptor subunit [Pseudomonadota bacterium]
MSDIDQLLQRFPLPSWRPGAIAVAGLITGGLIWATQAQLDRIAAAPGVIAPKGQVRTVEHLEGGVAERIHVREGDIVTAGQPLVEVQLGAAALNDAEILVRLDALRLERARLLAEAAQIDLTLPVAEAARQPDLAEAEQAAFRSRRREYRSSLAVLRDQRAQREQEITSTEVRMAAATRRLEPLREQARIAEALVEKQLMARSVMLGFTRDLKEVEAELRSLEAALPQARTALAEARERELFERNKFRNAAAERLREVEIEIARQAELYERAIAQRRRATIASPIDGVVKNLALKSVGAVVPAGQPVMEIVPTAEKLVVEARLSPADVGHVAVGQPARVKIATYDFLTYGVLDGRVTQIGADIDRSREGESYFRLVVETDADHLASGGRELPISAGMTADVDLILGQRSILRYLAEPVLRLREEAFRDR